MYTLSLYLFTSFTESSWEAADLPIFSLYVMYQIVFNVLRTPHLSMTSVYGLPKVAPNPAHDSALVTPFTLWWYNIFQDPCLLLKFLTIYPTDINTVVLSLLIPPTHKFWKKLYCLTQKKTGILLIAETPHLIRR